MNAVQLLKLEGAEGLLVPQIPHVNSWKGPVSLVSIVVAHLMGNEVSK